MKGFRTLARFQGYTVGAAELRYTPNGKMVCGFTIGVGGNREKGIKGAMIRCHAWDGNAERVEAIIQEAGLAVLVEGRFAQKAVEKGGKVYVNNDLNIDSLSVQASKSDDVLTEVEIARDGGKGGQVKDEEAEGERVAVGK